MVSSSRDGIIHPGTASFIRIPVIITVIFVFIILILIFFRDIKNGFISGDMQKMEIIIDVRAWKSMFVITPSYSGK